MWYLYGIMITMFVYYLLFVAGVIEDRIPMLGVLSYLLWPVGIFYLAWQIARKNTTT